MSGLRLITGDERLTYEGDGFKIFYRRIPTSKRGRIVEKNTKQGRETNWYQATVEMLEYCIIGWDGLFRVIDGKEEPTPYDPAYIGDIPEEVTTELAEKMGAAIPSQGIAKSTVGEVEAGN
jgi:hypothetical protein